MSPVARWHRQCSFFSTGDCVPLPQPGGPAYRSRAILMLRQHRGSIWHWSYYGRRSGRGNGTDQYEPLLGLQLAIQPPLHLGKQVIHADFAEIGAGCGHVVQAAVASTMFALSNSLSRIGRCNFVSDSSMHQGHACVLLPIVVDLLGAVTASQSDLCWCCCSRA